MQYEVSIALVMIVDTKTPEEAAHKVLTEFGLPPMNCQVRAPDGACYDIGGPPPEEARSWWSPWRK